MKRFFTVASGKAREQAEDEVFESHFAALEQISEYHAAYFDRLGADEDITTFYENKAKRFRWLSQQFEEIHGSGGN